MRFWLNGAFNRRQLQELLPLDGVPPLAVQGHVPKTAGKTVRRWIETQLPSLSVVSRKELTTSRPPAEQYFIYLGHLQPEILVDSGLLTSATLENTFTFIFVRNPFARAVSLYIHKSRFGYQENFPTFLHETRASWTNTRKPEFRRMRKMTRPATTWMGTETWPGWTNVFRLEDFDFACSTISEALDLEGSPTAIDPSPREFTRRIIGDYEQQLILEMYHSDFEKFGYGTVVPQELRAIE